jgi:hypothetical protein
VDGPRTAAVGGGGDGPRIWQAGWGTAVGSGSGSDHTERNAGGGGGGNEGDVRTSWVAMGRQMG